MTSNDLFLLKTFEGKEATSSRYLFSYCLLIFFEVNQISGSDDFSMENIKKTLMVVSNKYHKVTLFIYFGGQLHLVSMNLETKRSRRSSFLTLFKILLIYR